MDWHAGFHSTLRDRVRERRCYPGETHYIDISARVGNDKILSVVREAQSIDSMAVRNVRQHEMNRAGEPLTRSK